MNHRIRQKLTETGRNIWKEGEIYDYKTTVDFLSTELNMSIEELLAIPEQDTWTYSTHKSRAFTPGTFVAAAIEAYGIFHGMEVNTSEFTVPDIYRLNIYDKEFERPDICWEADYDLPYCQLFGKYRINLPDYSTIEGYKHMNEACPNQFEFKI